METINEIIAGVEEPPESFEQYLTQYADRVGDLVNSFIPKGTHADMDRYLYDPLISYSQNGGKRHRPLICFAACRAVGGDMARATSAAAAIEHFHTAALIHDDIADEAELRRGEPCMHLTEGMGLAINAGDLALSLVNGTVVSDKSLDDATKVRVITEPVSYTHLDVYKRQVPSAPFVGEQPVLHDEARQRQVGPVEQRHLGRAHGLDPLGHVVVLLGQLLGLALGVRAALVVAHLGVDRLDPLQLRLDLGGRLVLQLLGGLARDAEVLDLSLIHI